MSWAPLQCSVRTCGAPLAPQGRSWQCARGHTFDVAREGYVNLLQPQDRRSAQPGDPAPAVAARAHLGRVGLGRALNQWVRDRVASAWEGAPDSVLLDIGCGTGETLACLGEAWPGVRVGVDLSVDAARRAARLASGATIVVANADRHWPLEAQSVTVALSLHARRHPEEAARVVRPGGWLVVAVPSADDLRELRQALHGAETARDRRTAVIDAHGVGFQCVEQVRVRQALWLETPELLALLQATYRGQRSQAAGRASSLPAMWVTTASDVVVLRRD